MGVVKLGPMGAHPFPEERKQVDFEQMHNAGFPGFSVFLEGTHVSSGRPSWVRDGDEVFAAINGRE